MCITQINKQISIFMTI